MQFFSLEKYISGICSSWETNDLVYRFPETSFFLKVIDVSRLFAKTTNNEKRIFEAIEQCAHSGYAKFMFAFDSKPKLEQSIRYKPWHRSVSSQKL